MLCPCSAMASAMSASSPGRSLHCTTSQVICPSATGPAPAAPPRPSPRAPRPAGGGAAVSGAGAGLGSRCVCSRKNLASLCRAVFVCAYLTHVCAPQRLVRPRASQRSSLRGRAAGAISEAWGHGSAACPSGRRPRPAVSCCVHSPMRPGTSRAGAARRLPHARALLLGSPRQRARARTWWRCTVSAVGGPGYVSTSTTSALASAWLSSTSLPFTCRARTRPVTLRGCAHLEVRQSPHALLGDQPMHAMLTGDTPLAEPGSPQASARTSSAVRMQAAAGTGRAFTPTIWFPTSVCTWYAKSTTVAPCTRRQPGLISHKHQRVRCM